eukprot:scaffold363_cov331-Pavlova_lutheri.AAC.48
MGCHVRHRTRDLLPFDSWGSSGSKPGLRPRPTHMSMRASKRHVEDPIVKQSQNHEIAQEEMDKHRAEVDTQPPNHAREG